MGRHRAWAAAPVLKGGPAIQKGEVRAAQARLPLAAAGAATLAAGAFAREIGMERGVAVKKKIAGVGSGREGKEPGKRNTKSVCSAGASVRVAAGALLKRPMCCAAMPPQRSAALTPKGQRTPAAAEARRLAGASLVSPVHAEWV